MYLDKRKNTSSQLRYMSMSLHFPPNLVRKIDFEKKYLPGQCFRSNFLLPNVMNNVFLINLMSLFMSTPVNNTFISKLLLEMFTNTTYLL